jgi:hypothetical protein
VTPVPQPPSTERRRRLAIFAALLALCAIGAAVAIVVAVSGNGGDDHGTAAAARVLPAARAAGTREVVYRSPSNHGEVALAPLGADGRPGRATLGTMHCARVYFSPAGNGICLATGTGFAAGYRARIFDARLNVTHDIGVQGVPSRARVSPDGRYGSVTLFVTGHAYATAGTFSTATTLIDMRRGTKIADLEQFTAYRNGRVVTAIDVNYWGVTFSPADSDTFYATLATGGRTYLVKGSIANRRMDVLQDNVECPSLSPDGTRIAFKKRTGTGNAPWHLTVLDLRTMRETPLAEPRSIDDQVEWLDDGHVLYGTQNTVFTVPADGSGRPARFLADADSPAVVRW